MEDHELDLKIEKEREIILAKEAELKAKNAIFEVDITPAAGEINVTAVLKAAEGGVTDILV